MPPTSIANYTFKMSSWLWYCTYMTTGGNNVKNGKLLLVHYSCEGWDPDHLNLTYFQHHQLHQQIHVSRGIFNYVSQTSKNTILLPTTVKVEKLHILLHLFHESMTVDSISVIILWSNKRIVKELCLMILSWSRHCSESDSGVLWGENKSVGNW